MKSIRVSTPEVKSAIQYIEASEYAMSVYMVAHGLGLSWGFQDLRFRV